MEANPELSANASEPNDIALFVPTAAESTVPDPFKFRVSPPALLLIVEIDEFCTVVDPS